MPLTVFPRVVTSVLTVFSCEPLTASLLVAEIVPSATSVILLSVPLTPCLALKAELFQSRASFSRSSTSAFRAEILVVWSPTVVLMPLTVSPRVVTSVLTVFSCEPLTASLLVAETVPSLTLVILLVASEPCAALYTPLSASHCTVLSLSIVSACPTVLAVPFFNT